MLRQLWQHQRRANQFLKTVNRDQTDFLPMIILFVIYYFLNLLSFAKEITFRWLRREKEEHRNRKARPLPHSRGSAENPSPKKRPLSWVL